MRDQAMEIWKRIRKTDRIQAGTALFYFAFASLLFVRLNNWSVGDSFFIFSANFVFHTGLRLTAVLLAVKGIFFQRMSLLQRFLALLLVLVTYLSYKACGDYSLVALASFIVCGQGVKAKNMAWVFLIVSVPWTIFKAILACLGRIENIVYYRGSFARYAMGYGNPNTFGMMIFAICLSWCAVQWGKDRRSDFLVIALGALLCFFVSESRTFVISLILLAGLLMIQRYGKNERTMRKWILALTILVGICVVFSFFSMVFFTDQISLYVLIDQFVSNRFMLSNVFFEEYGIPLLGRNYDSLPAVWEGYSFLVDNLYCHILLKFGLAVCVLFLAGMVFYYRDALKRGTWSLCLVGLSLYFLIGLTENISMTIEMNYFMIAFSGIFFKESEKNFS